MVMRTATVVALVAVFLAVAITPFTDDSDAAGIIVTDGIGNIIF